MRMNDKVVILIGAGQSPGEGVGNGRAAALLYAREGARVLAVDSRLDSAQETAAAVINLYNERRPDGAAGGGGHAF